MSGGVSDTNY